VPLLGAKDDSPQQVGYLAACGNPQPLVGIRRAYVCGPICVVGAKGSP